MNKYEELKTHHKFMLQQARDEGYDLECAFQSGVLKTLDELEKDIKKAQAFDIIIKHSYIGLNKDVWTTLSILNKGSNILGTVISDKEYELLKEVLEK